MAALVTPAFYAFAAVTLAGALAATLLPSGNHRLTGLAAMAAGLAGLYLTLSGGLAAVIALVCYLAIAGLLGGRALRARVLVDGGRLARHASAPAAALTLAVVLYVAWRASFVIPAYSGGIFNLAALGHLLFARDALAVEAAAALLMAAMVAMRRLGTRSR